MQGTLKVKRAPGYTTDDGTVVPEHDLYRFVDDAGKGGCWYSKVENAQKSWDRAHAAPTEAQAAADALLAEYDLVVSPTTRRLLAVAYSRGALAAATEAVEAVKRA
jgi:hypothetical protein